MVFRICFGTALLAVALVAVSGFSVAPAQAGSSDISYNEVTKIIMGGSTPAPGAYANGSFDGDFQAASQQQAKKGGGFFAAINAMKSAMSMLHNGTANSYSYLNNQEREDDVSSQTGTISLPDKNQIIHLDLAKKTYWMSAPNTAHLMETPPPAQPQQSGPQGPQPSPQPGTAKVAITVSTVSLGSKNLGGENTDGYQMTFKVVSSQATGSCANGTFQTSITEFVSRYAEPSIKWPSSPMVYHPSVAKIPNPEMAAFHPGCVPKVTTRVHTGQAAPSNRLVMWEMLSVNGSAQPQQGPMAGGFSTLIERGDVRPLGSGDQALFGPPAGFTQQPNPEQ